MRVSQNQSEKISARNDKLFDDRREVPQGYFQCDDVAKGQFLSFKKSICYGFKKRNMEDVGPIGSHTPECEHPGNGATHKRGAQKAFWYFWLCKSTLGIKYLGIITILTLSYSLGTNAKSGEDALYNSLSYTLESIIKSDLNILQRGYTGNLLSRIDVYRKGIYNEAQEIYPLIPSVWSKRPSLDTTYLYSPYIQKYPLSCEIATVKMILGSYGKRRSEESIYRAIPRDYSALSGGVWGDPDEEFVGSLTGTQGGRTGYGIYEAPLAKYLSNEGYTTEIINSNSHTRQLRPKQHLIYLINQVQLGSRVILWGDWCTESADEDGILPKGGKSILQYFPISAKNYCSRSSEKRKFSWETPENRTINAISGEHTFILLGYIGSLDNPTHIIVWDTYTGRHIFSYAEWMRKWELLDYRSLRVEKKS